MQKQVTFGHILSILAIIVLPLLVWGINVETRFEKVIENSNNINIIKIEQKENSLLVNENYIEIIKQLNRIELKVNDKKDR